MKDEILVLASALWLYKVQAAEETKGVAYGDNGLLKNSVLNKNLLQTFKKHTHAQESHSFRPLLGLSEVPCPPWLYSLVLLLQLLDYASLLLSLFPFTQSSN